MADRDIGRSFGAVCVDVYSFHNSGTATVPSRRIRFLSDFGAGRFQRGL
jgi:hypothetical protein